MRRVAATLLLVIALAAPAEGQALTVGLSAYRSFGIDDLDGELPLSAEFRVTVPISDRFALEPFIVAGSHSSRRKAGLEGFYGAQIRQRIVPFTRKSSYAFVTYGAAAYYSNYSTFESPGPIIGHFGLGLRLRVSEHLAFRPEVHLVTFHVVPIGARLVAGFSAGR